MDESEVLFQGKNFQIIAKKTTFGRSFECVVVMKLYIVGDTPSTMFEKVFSSMEECREYFYNRIEEIQF